MVTIFKADITTGNSTNKSQRNLLYIENGLQKLLEKDKIQRERAKSGIFFELVMKRYAECIELRRKYESRSEIKKQRIKNRVEQAKQVISGNK